MEKSYWMEKLSLAKNLSEAEGVVCEALMHGNRQSLLEFFKDLYEEFSGPDECGGGATGTLSRMALIQSELRFIPAELEKAGIDTDILKSYFFHGSPLVVARA